MVKVDDFRRLFQAQVSTVAVITTAIGDELAGLTATAVCSFQDTPPTLLASINRNSNAYRIICTSRRFAVNFLAADQEHVASRFAKHAANAAESAQKFQAAGTWREGPNGLPMLCGAAAAAECEVAQLIEMNTHAILIGHIVHVDAAHEGENPLLYGARRYVRLADAQEATC